MSLLNKKMSANKYAQKKKSFKKSLSGQGALEYILIIGGAILVAAVVIAIVANSSSTAADDAADAQTKLDSSKDALEGIADDALSNVISCEADDDCVEGYICSDENKCVKDEGP